MKNLLLISMTFIVLLSAKAEVVYNVTVPTGTKVCYIAGAMNGYSQQAMTKVDDTHYTLTIASATTSHKYKYCSGPTWAYQEKQANCTSDIADRTYASNDVVACWAEVYDPAVVAADVVYSVTVPVGTNVVYFNGNATGWAFTAMTKVDATHYTITLNTTTSNGYKYCAGNGWSFTELQADCTSNLAGDRNYSANDVVACWKSVATNLDNTIANSAVITSSNRTITANFEGVAKVEIYTITGIAVSSFTAEETFSEVVEAGIYIVRISGKTSKVIVK